MTDVRRTLRIEAMARAIWNYYYPQGGSIFRSYDELLEQDKELHRNEAKQVAAFLDGGAVLTKRPEVKTP